MRAGDKVHTARKEYRCNECKEPIARDEQYVARNIYGEKWRLHLRCAETTK